MKTINKEMKLSAGLMVLGAVLAVGCKPSGQEAVVAPSDRALTVQAASPSPTPLLPMKTTEEMKSLETAANQGDAQAQFELGQRYFQGQGVARDYKQAHHWCLKAAEQDVVPAQIYVGVMNAEALGVAKDYSEALRWYRRAAAKNDPKGQFNLGIMYDNGQGVPQDSEEAFQWFTKAAEQDFAKAQYNVGTMYDNGQGVKQDLVASYFWFNRAYENGYAEALEARNGVTKRMTAEQLAQIESGNFSGDSTLSGVASKPSSSNR